MGKIDDFLKINNKSNVPEDIFIKIRKLGYSEEIIDNIGKSEIEDIIIKLSPTSKRAIITTCTILLSYAKFTNNDRLNNEISNLDKNSLWIKIKEKYHPKKYISHKDYLDILNDIQRCEELNMLYTKTLFQAVYEGIYCGDMSVIFNLRGSDICDNIATLHTYDGFIYSMEISNSLANSLIKLSELDVMEIRNAHSVFESNTYGKYPDTCFKTRNKINVNEEFKHAYYRKFRNITTRYVGYNLSPSQLFISGIMYRISLEFESNNINIEDAFLLNNRDRTVANIMRKEMDRCNLDIPVSSLREKVADYLEVFM